MHARTHTYWDLQQVGNDTICLWFQLSNMRTLTPAEKEQCNLIAINCMPKQSHGPAVYLVHRSAEQCKAATTVQFSAAGGGGGASGRCVVTNPLLCFRETCVSGFPAAFYGTLVWRHVKLAGRDRSAKLASWQADTRHPSPHEIKANNQDLTSCPWDRTVLWSEKFATLSVGTACVCMSHREWVNVGTTELTVCSSHLRICVLYITQRY